MSSLPSRHSGFSLVELVMVMAVAIILMAVAIPMINVSDRMRVNEASQQVRQELSTARLKAVSVNRALQLRFNCPSVGEYRIVEAGAFSEANRCDAAVFPYPAPPDAQYQTPPMPRYDGPLRRVNARVDLNSGDRNLVLQFMPDGRVLKVVGGTATLIASEDITVAIGSLTRTINVNAFGKIRTAQ